MLTNYQYQSEQEEDSQAGEDYRWELNRAEQLSMQRDGEAEMVCDMDDRDPEPLQFN